ncbi:hypothetical protein Tcan_13170 [Toxocara canis]|uniref:G protein-coupled receptor n=1 Tax=Toxocara canis TaxID=6265 RepID=A0A0B2VXZ8_TOXCA|nr:hypothetical protein Tcan_13170 [Toxocara canis]
MPQILFTLLIFLFNLDLISLPIGIVFSYGQICNVHIIKQIYTVRYLPIIAVMFPLIALGAALIIQPCLIFSRSPVQLSVYPFMGDPIHVQLSSNGMIPMIAYSVFFVIATVNSYSLMTYSARRIFAKLRTVKMSAQCKKLHRALTLCMILQALLPLLFSTMPMTAFITLIVAPAKIDFYGTTILAALNWQPCIYPLLSVSFIRPFRAQLQNWSSRFCCRCSFHSKSTHQVSSFMYAGATH